MLVLSKLALWYENNMKTPEKYIIGPSHLHDEYTKIISSKIKDGFFFKNCKIDGHRGIPIWSRYIFDTIEREYNAGKDVIWMVSDFKFNNSDYEKINSIIETNNPFLDEMGSPGNINGNFLEVKHITTLGFHSINIIDKIINNFKNIKLIFWCLYTRSRIRESSYPKWMQYKYIKNRYRNNIIDIDIYSSPEVFPTLVNDAGGHPNEYGYNLIDCMINNKIIKNKNKLPSINNLFFSDQKFDFLRSNGEFISEIFLKNDGTIEIYNNDNEKKWILKNERLIFLSSSDLETTVFDRAELHGNVFYMIGDFMDSTRPKHILRKVLYSE